MDINRFLLNTNSKKYHDLKYADGRCKISDMKDSFKIYFNTLEEASKYPNQDKPLAEFCSICEKNKAKNEISPNFKK